MVSLAARETLVPAPTVKVADDAGVVDLAGAGLTGWGVRVRGAGLGVGDGAGGGGTSLSAAVDSVGASARFRAVASSDWLACSPFAHANNAAAAIGTSV